MLAMLCGGQGTLSPDLFRLTAGREEAAGIFAEAAALLGRDPRAIACGDDPATRMNRTSQILVTTALLALHACIAESVPRRFAVAGYSVGEMAAWSIAGIWPPRETLRLTEQRALAMDAAGGTAGQLGYVRGLDPSIVEDLAARHRCAIAIVGPDRLFVVGGQGDDVTAFCRAAEAAGAARSAPIAVHVASHTVLLADAVAPFRQALEAAPTGEVKAGCILIAGGNGARIYRPRDAISGLAADVARMLDWSATLQALVESGADRFLDLGPGHALADMARSVGKGIPARAGEDFHTLEGLRGWMDSA
jgi:[acyl-carrier-protein] S-malonyltransferase